MVKRKWLMLPLFLIVCLLFACGKAATGGDVTAVERTIPEDAKYTQEEIAAAMDLVEKKFERDFKGCTLQKLRYDESAAGEEQKWAQQYGADEAIVLFSDFHTDKNVGDGFNGDYDYTNWNWILVRKGGGSWVLRTWGYG